MVPGIKQFVFKIDTRDTLGWGFVNEIPQDTAAISWRKLEVSDLFDKVRVRFWTPARIPNIFFIGSSRNLRDYIPGNTVIVHGKQTPLDVIAMINCQLLAKNQSSDGASLKGGACQDD